MVRDLWNAGAYIGEMPGSSVAGAAGDECSNEGSRCKAGDGEGAVKLGPAALAMALLTGCAAQHAAHPFVPRACMRPITIEDFGKSCRPVNSTTAICDDVTIHFDCVQYKGGK